MMTIIVENTSVPYLEMMPGTIAQLALTMEDAFTDRWKLEPFVKINRPPQSRSLRPVIGSP